MAWCSGKNTVLASGGTRPGPISFVPTVSLFLLDKWGVGCGLNSPLKHKMCCFLCHFERRHNLVQFYARLSMLTPNSMWTAQRIYFLLKTSVC